MRIAFTTLAVVSSLTGVAVAQETSFFAAGGRTMYDAAGDQFYPLLRVGAERRVGSAIRVGFTGSRTDVNQEHLWRVVATLRVGSYGSTSRGVVRRLAPWAEAAVGLIHSGGTRRPSLVPNPDLSKRTGPALGAGAGLDVALLEPLALRIGYHLWQDFILGNPKFDTDEVVGLVLRF